MRNIYKLSVAVVFLLSLVFSSIEAQVVANFNPTIASDGCGIATYELKDISTRIGIPIDPATTYFTWSFGNGNGVVKSLGTQDLGSSAGFANSPKASYGAAGEYTVRMTIEFVDDPGVTYTVTKKVIVYEKSSPNFSASSTVGCAPFTTTFTDITDVSSNIVGDKVGWIWNFGDGNISNQQNPTHTYLNPGLYQVTLTVQTDAGGLIICSGVTIRTGYIEVRHTPTASFNVTTLPACNLPFTAVFNNTSTIGVAPSPPGVLSSFKWTFYDNDGVTEIGNSTVEDPIEFYNGYGTYAVKLTATSTHGCTSTVYVPNAISITDNIADFTFPATGLCANSSILFSDASTVGAIAWSWNFGDGNLSTLQNPFHAYVADGAYTVTLRTTFADGCIEIVTKSINILALPSAEFTALPIQPLCSTPMLFNFAPLTAPPGATYAWNFDDTSAAFGGQAFTQNAAWTFNSYGTYDINLQITNSNGCVGTFIKNITLTKPVANFTIVDTPNGCAPQTIEFLSTSAAIESITNYDWYFGGVLSPDHSDNPSHTFNAPGFYDVRLVISTVNGCTDEKTLFNAIQVGAPVIITAITNDRGGCRMDGSSNGIVLNALVTEPPTIDSIRWNFGDGGSLWMLAQPYTTTRFFEQIGTITPSITAYNNGCATVFNAAAGIGITGAIARFSVDNSGVGCSSTSTITFNNTTSIDAATGITTYTWDFGDGTVLTLPKGSGITHTYVAPGDYTVRLTANGEGCNDWIEQNVIVTASTPAFNILQASPVCSSTPITIQDASTTSVNGTIVQWQWFLGDGTVITRNNNSDVVHSYNPNNTNYEVYLKITEQNGCTYTSPSQFINIQGAVANFTNNPSNCKETSVQFTDLSTTVPPANHIVTWNWDFGDPASGVNNGSIAQHPTHVFSAPGVYTVTLTVTDNSTLPLACNSSYSRMVTILEQPSASFTTTRNKYCTTDPGPIQFVNTSTTPSGTLEYLWDFGDGNTSTVQDPLHQYASNGIWTVTLTVKATSGCISTFNKVIQTVTPNLTLYVKGAVAASHNFTCPPAVADFVAVASPNSGFTNWNWTFGDGNTSSVQNPINTYVFPGNYNVRLVAVSDAGCNFDVMLNNFITVQGPKGEFVYAPNRLCYPDQVSFDANNLSGMATVQWDYGDGDVSPVYTLTPGQKATLELNGDEAGISLLDHTYTLPGIFNPFLILKDNQVPACQVQYPASAGPIRSSGNPEFANFTWTGGGEICKQVQFSYFDASIEDTYPTPNYLDPNINQWYWTFYDTDGVTILDFATVQNPTFTYTTEGVYNVKLKVTTQFGCTAEVTKTITIVAPEITAAIIIGIPVVCAGESVPFDGTTSFSNSGSGTNIPLTYLWKFYDTDGVTLLGTSTLPKPNFVYAQEGKYTVELIVNDAVYCAAGDIDVESVTVKALPAFLSEPAPLTVCEGDNGTFTTAPNAITFFNGNVDYQWQVNDGGGWVDIIASHPDIAFYSNYTSLNQTLPSTLTITNTPASFNGYQYRCIVKHTYTTLCYSTSNSALLTVNRDPSTATVGPAQILCGANSVAMTGNTPAVGLGTWTKVSGPADALILNPNSPTTTIQIGTGIYQFQWKIENGVCPSSPLVSPTVIVTNSKPANAGTDQAHCNVNIFTLAGNNPLITGGTGDWTQTTALAGAITTSTLYNSAVTGVTTGTYTFKWTITGAPGCGNTNDEVNIINYALPTFTTSPANNTICQGQSAVFSVAAGALNYQWQKDDGGGSGFVNIVNGGNYAGATTAILTISNIPNLYNFYKFRCVVTNTATTCTNTSTVGELRVIATPANLVSDHTICPGVPISVTVYNTILGYAYELRNAANVPVETVFSAANGSNVIFTPFTPAVSEIYSVWVTTTSLNGANCTIQLTDKSNVTVTGSTPVTSVIAGSSSVCINKANVAYSVVNTAGSTYNWTVPADATLVTGQGTNNILVTFGANPVTISVVQTNSTGCVALPVDLLVQTNPNPVVTFVPDGPFCRAAGTIALTGGAPAGGVYSGTGITAPSTFSLATAGTFNIGYSYTTIDGCSGTANANVVVNSLPAPVIAGDNSVCANESGVVYTTPNNAGSSYLWTIINGAITGGQGTNQITVNWAGANGSINVKETTIATGCATTTANYNVTVVALIAPTGASTTRNNFCADDAGTISLSSAGGMGTRRWFTDGCGTTLIGSGTPLVIPSPTVTTTYYVLSEDACLNQSACQSVTVTVNPMPVAGFSAAFPQLCVNSGVYTLTQGIPAVGTYSGTGVTAPNLFNPLTSGPGGFPILYTYTTGGCTDTETQFLTVNAIPNPVIVGNNTVCNNEITNYTVTNTGNSFNWTVTGGVISAGVGTNQISVTWGAAGPGTVSVRETIVATGCNVTSATLNVTINELLPPTSIDVDKTNFCADDAGNIELSVGGGSGANVVWYNTSCGVGLVGTGNPLVIPSPLVSTTYYARWESSCGESTCLSIPVTVNPLPNSNLNLTDENVCDFQNATIALLSSQAGVNYQLRYDATNLPVAGQLVPGTGGDITFTVNTPVTTVYNVLATNNITGCAIELVDVSALAKRLI